MDQTTTRALLEEGLRCRSAGDPKGAAGCFRAVLAADPHNGPALHGMGLLALDGGHPAVAEKFLERALAGSPDQVQLLHHLGVTLARSNKPAAALERLQQARALAPADPQIALSLAGSLSSAGRDEEAEALYRLLVEQHPQVTQAAYQLAMRREEQGRTAEALALYDQALAVQPAMAEARYNRGLLHLAAGRCGAGWQDLRACAAPDGPARPPEAGWWAGRTVLLDRWQGLGDQLFHLRFVSRLTALGARIWLRPAPKIAALLSRMAGVAGVLEPDRQPAVEAAIWSMGDLPWLTGMTRLEEAPPPLPLQPLPERLGAVRTLLHQAGPGPWLGVTWRAGLAPAAGDGLLQPLRKAVDPLELGRALAGWPGGVVILQRQPEPGEVTAFCQGLGREALDGSAFNEDLEWMLALLALLDDHVAVSNTNVHLRAGTGRATRVLVQHPPEWRWAGTGLESVWLPGCPVYRQTAAGDWRDALARLAAGLGRKI
ncbi:MAG: tetratricopeptide repeat protein [Magnetococcales bacterium]|nr:tetratricopeptide repeat protein [Magnetococcales bacterium]